jgi:hypothetical protein
LILLESKDTQYASGVLFLCSFVGYLPLPMYI